MRPLLYNLYGKTVNDKLYLTLLDRGLEVTYASSLVFRVL